MFSHYMETLGKCAKDIINKMANIGIGYIKINQKGHIELTYSIAHSIQYEDFENKIKGNFILGFIDEPTAIMVASAIAKNAGLTPSMEFDETASDIISEFLNTIVGHTIAEWDRKGLNLRFNPPDMLKDKRIKVIDSPETETYLLKFEFSDDTIMLDFSGIELMVSFKRSLKNKLMGKRILVVDDSKVMRNIIARALEKKGVQVKQAKDGKEAIEKFTDFKPDLSIMDLVMPEMGGLDAIMEIRESNPDAKFIVLTSSSRRDEILTAKTLNVSAYIIKPLDMEKLLEKINEVINDPLRNHE